MSAPALLDLPPAQQDGAPPRQARLAALRDAAQRLDPARLHYLDVLSQRIATAPDAVQRVLEGKLDAALADLEGRLQQAHATARVAVSQLSAAPLAELNQYLRGLKQPGDGQLSGLSLESRHADSLGSDGDTRTELASVRRFRDAWSRITAEEQVMEAVRSGPANAGPLNSHRLVLHTLAVLRGLSPDYLRRFLSQMETLQWLEQASQMITPAKAKPARRSRIRK